jgi:hypothetical protein
MLNNSRHEAFAVLLAGGVAQDEAYTRAGYSKKGAAQSASRLAKTRSVAARIEELNRSRSDSIGHAFLTRTQLDRDLVVDILTRNAAAAFAKGDHSAVNRAAELLGRELGMFREKPQISWDGDLDKLSLPQLENLLASMDRRLTEPDNDSTKLLGPVV